MSQKYAYVQDEEVVRTLQNSLELELSELRSLHEAQADDLQEAFSPGVINLLRQLSEDDSFFQYPTPEESSPSESTEDSSDYWTATRMTFKFLCDEFMPAPRDQQMGRFQTFLDQVRGTASRIRLPGGANLSPDQNATLRQCVTAVKTMKEVLGSKFASLQKYVRMQMEQGSRRPYSAGGHQTTAAGFATGTSFASGHHSTAAQGFTTGTSSAGGRHTTDPPGFLQGFATGMRPGNVPQTESSASSVRHETIFGSVQRFSSTATPTDPDSSAFRHETIFRYSGASNPEVSRVIRDNPTTIRGPGDTQVLTRTGVIVSNVIQIIQETQPRASVVQAPAEERRQGASTPSPPKRKPLKRQSHVVEED